MYVLRAFCAFSFLVIIFHSLALSHSLTLCLSVSFLLLLLLFVCCVHSLSIIFCVSNKQLQLTPPLFPLPSTFNPNKPTIFFSLPRTRFPRAICARFKQRLFAATCNPETYNLFKYFSLILFFHLCILLSCLLRHVSQARLTITDKR